MEKSIRERADDLYQPLKKSIWETGELKHFQKQRVEMFTFNVIWEMDNRRNPTSLTQEFLTWGYKMGYFKKDSFAKKDVVWKICVFIDWKQEGEGHHDLNNHMVLAAQKPVTKKMLEEAAQHALELLGDNPEALSDEAKEDIMGASPQPAT